MSLSASHAPEPVPHGRTSPASAKALVLVLEVVQPLGKEHHDHEEKEEDERSHAHHHTQHLELGDGPVTACALVPDVVLHIAPAQKRFRERSVRLWRFSETSFVVLLLLVTVFEQKTQSVQQVCLDKSPGTWSL